MIAMLIFVLLGQIIMMWYQIIGSFLAFFTDGDPHAESFVVSVIILSLICATFSAALSRISSMLPKPTRKKRSDEFPAPVVPIPLNAGGEVQPPPGARGVKQ